MLQVKRDKNVVKPGKGKRQCNCKNKVVTRQLGPGMFQQYTTQECETCQAVKLEREAVTLSVNVDPGMRERQVPPFTSCFSFLGKCCDLEVTDTWARVR